MSWVGTKLTFDHEVSYPRIEFTAISYVTEDQDAQIAEVMKSPTIERILYGFGPTETATETEAAEPEIAGTPPARTTGGNVRSLPARAAPPEPDPEEPVEGDPMEPADEEEPPPPPPAAAASTPFQAATKRAPGRVSTQTTPALAPSDLEGAIDDLLDQPS